MKRILTKLETQKESHLTIAIDGGALHLNTSIITYIETDRRHLIIHTTQNTYTCRSTLKIIEEQLKGNNFFRCHNVYLVNLNYVEAIIGNYVIVANQKLLVSRYKKKAFLDVLTNYKGAQI